MGDLTDSTLFKALDGLEPVYGGDGRYPGVGRWTKHLDPDRLEPCVYGYHLARGPQIFDWIGPTLYVAEACPDHPPVNDSDKLVTCRVRLVRRLDRWDETTARLFAADCAEAALLGERMSGREPDERSWAAVEAARAFARGEIRSAALSAALSAARDAAWDASTAARDAAWDAAWDAARYAAAAARDAAWDASRDAAWNAAWNAAWAAAWNAARAADRAAAAATRDAAQDALYRRLCAYLEGAPIPPVEPLYGKEAPGE